MPCPTCSHQMAKLNTGDLIHYHCPRCGTLQSLSPGGHVDTCVPRLIDRIHRLKSAWLDILESITRKE
jgi:phage FluMu protein Com